MAREETVDMAVPNTQMVECDILIIGGGMAGCGAAFEAKYWGKNLRVVLVEKAAIERSGADRRGPFRHQLLHGAALRLEYARRLCQVCRQRHDGTGPGGPGL